MSIKISAKYNTVDKMRAGVKSVLSRAVSWRNDVQQLGVAVLNHAREHGDWTLTRDLLDGLSKTNGVNKTGATRWAEHYMHAKLTEVPDEKTGKIDLKFIFDEGKGVKDIDVEGAAGTNWFEFKPAPTDKSKDLEQIRESLAKMFVASIKTNKVEIALAENILSAFDNAVDEYTTEELKAELKEVA